MIVGEVVVYGGHGVGRITAAPASRAAGQQTVVLECSGGLTITLPLARAQQCLRPLSTEAELRLVQRTLRSAESPFERTWQRRVRATRGKLTEGLATGLAEVTRDGIHRERRQGADGPAGASPQERRLYLTARNLLATEISAARGIDHSEADDWIAAQVAAR